MKRLVYLTIAAGMALTVSAQDSTRTMTWGQRLKDMSQKVRYEMMTRDIFQRVEGSLTLGTTGIGVDFSSPVGEAVDVRAGYSFMPHFHYHMNFDVQVGEVRDDSKFEQLAGLLKQFTGYEVERHVPMVGVPTYHNFKLLVDVKPFRENRNWHFTGGFYWGNSDIAKAYNGTEAMTSLLAVGMYNQMYEKAMNYEPFFVYDWSGRRIAFTEDPELQDIVYDKFSGYGRMGVHIGNFKDGKPYMMEPDASSMVRATVKVNSFKPYLGFGYGGQLIKGDDRFHVSFDCGMLFWGGMPKVVTHDGTDLTRDVDNVGGKVGTYVDLLKSLKVFPVLEARFTTHLF